MRGVKPLDLVETIRDGILALDPDLTHPLCQLRPKSGDAMRSAALE
jgi:hypothetical protein